MTYNQLTDLTGWDIEKIVPEFRSSFVKLIGDGSSTIFWHDPWLTEQPLKTVYKRLYHMKKNSRATVMDRISWSDLQQPTFLWDWSRTPTGRTREDLDNLTNRLSLYVKSDRSDDTWIWKSSNKGSFCTKTVARVINENVNIHTNSSRYVTLRNNFVPLKVEVFIWRLIRGRLPVRVELDKRGIDLNSVRCPLCDDDVETLDHAFIFCKYAMDVWERVYKWWGFNGVAN
ncbi:uncharacterized protein [Rutidosis leptorrhynchoides]|uniref:uncharacterized protein n=1 Tax=Rutidosis leptorrhynchoides TaxID=125765 RepID=UPI003A98D666